MNKDLMKNIKVIAHRLGYKMTDYPENSMDSIKSIFNNKELLSCCDGFEFDICFTKDNIPVVIHDKKIDDYTDKKGYIKDYTLKELKQIKFGYRKSLKVRNNYYFEILTLEEVLKFFLDNKKLLGDKIIKIETKDYLILNKINLQVLTLILKKYKELNQNIVHLSFNPFNLIMLRNMQKKNNCYITKSDLLCNNKYRLLWMYLTKNIDSVTFGLKEKSIFNKKNLSYAVIKFNTIGIYTIKDKKDILEVFDIVKGNDVSKIQITSNNPKLVKNFY